MDTIILMNRPMLGTVATERVSATSYTSASVGEAIRVRYSPAKAAFTVSAEYRGRWHCGDRYTLEEILECCDLTREQLEQLREDSIAYIPA